MRILLINYEYPPFGGGGGVFSQLLTEEWRGQGHGVDVVTSSLRGKRGKASLFSLLIFPLLGFGKGLKLCLKNKYDVINTHFAIPTGPVGFLLGKLFKIKNVLSIHGADIYDPTRKIHNNFLLRPVIKFILNHADLIIAQSKNTRENAIRYYQPKKRIEIIPLGIKIPLLPKKQPSKIFTIISIGRLVKRKSFEYLVRAIPSDIKLQIIGTGPEKENLLKLNPRVEILENILEKEKWQHLVNADLFVLSSLHEGFSLACLEAMAAGLPIIATNIGGQTDFLTEENAILIEPKNIQTLKMAITKIKNNQELKNKLSKNNLEKIKQFNIAKIANVYLEVFKQI